eukprot:847758-Amphidinium_carterae.1
MPTAVSCGAARAAGLVESWDEKHGVACHSVTTVKGALPWTHPRRDEWTASTCQPVTRIETDGIPTAQC